MIVHWHRRDLRGTDNHALAQAASTGSVIPVFVIDPTLVEFAGAPRVTFMLDCLSSLRHWYRERGSDLVVRVGDPATELPAIGHQYEANDIVWNDDYSGLATRRDTSVRTSLHNEGITETTYADAYLYAPGSITTQTGDPYSIFSYFWEKWWNREPDPPYPPPNSGQLCAVSDTKLPTRRELECPAPEADVPAGGTEVATHRLETFCDEPIYRYAERRDLPAANATSRLSPHLKWGTVGIRTVLEAVERAMADAANETAAESCQEFARQLAWRDFYGHVLANAPQIVSTDYRTYDRPIRWRTDPAGLNAWKDGMTGFPIVDAGMRQLRDEAVMHNRVRMIVASFLTKDLLIDWRAGYAWFRETLVDHDPANDAGGWQWVAGTGTDAQPYFRIFNPMTQGERYDPDAEYIRRYIPELETVPTVLIHSWTQLDPEERTGRAPAYPDPIVDHAVRRELAIEMFEEAR